MTTKNKALIKYINCTTEIFQRILKRQKEKAEKFLALKEKLGKLIDVRWDYKMVEITQEEILKYQQNQAKMLSENPEIVEMLSKCDFNK